MASDGASDLKPVRVAIVDDDPNSAAHLADVLRRDGDFEVVAQAEGIDELLNGPGRTARVVVLDALLRGYPLVADNVARISATGALVLIVSCYFEEADVYGALSAGAAGFLRKTSGSADLPGAVRDVLAGQFVVSRQAMLSLLNGEARSAVKLTARETQVLALYVSGLPLKSVARQLGISFETAKSHIERIRQRFRMAGHNVDDKISLRVAATKDGLLPRPITEDIR